MLNVNIKLRTVIALGLAGAALAGSGVASAATVRGLPQATHAPVAVVTAPARSLNIDPGKVGSAGIPGYDDAECQSLADNYNAEQQIANDDQDAGNAQGAGEANDAASYTKGLIDDNCIVID